MSTTKKPILAVNNLNVEFDTYGGTIHAVRDVSFELKKGETLAIVGESGCGKSVTVQSIMGLIPSPPGRIVSGSAEFEGNNLLALDEKNLNNFRGKKIAMIFQDALSSLNPTMTIGKQIAETLRIHEGLSSRDAKPKVIELLEKVQIPEAEKRINQFPFEFSGGMLQRVMIAMSLACQPEILIADEPTTALDVTIQAQILNLLQELQQKQGLAIVLITHDLGVVAKMAHQVAVMYAGQIIETGTVDEIFYQTAHPYTQGLKAAMPSNANEEEQHLHVIEGSPPDLFSPPSGCGFFDRCSSAMKICENQQPPQINLEEQHYTSCWLKHKDCPI